jgi:hypothetical protein
MTLRWDNKYMVCREAQRGVTKMVILTGKPLNQLLFSNG